MFNKVNPILLSIVLVFSVSLGYIIYSYAQIYYNQNYKFTQTIEMCEKNKTQCSKDNSGAFNLKYNCEYSCEQTITKNYSDSKTNLFKFFLILLNFTSISLAFYYLVNKYLFTNKTKKTKKNKSKK